MLAPACRGVARLRPMDDAPAGARPEIGRATATAPHTTEVWVATDYEPLRAVLTEAVAAVTLPARVMSGWELRGALRNRPLPRGLLLDDSLLDGDQRLLTAAGLVDHLAVCTHDVMEADRRRVAGDLALSARWLAMPFTLDEFVATIRWLGGGGETWAAAGWHL